MEASHPYMVAKRILPYLLQVAAVAIYVQGINGKFVWDDVTYFVENDILTQLSPFNLSAIFFQPSNYWGELLPVRDFLYVLEYRLFGSWTTGYHIISLLLFLGSANVLFRWMKEMVMDHTPDGNGLETKTRMAWISANIIMAFFLFHPAYVECVAYISGQKYILSIFFTLLSLRLFYHAGKDWPKGVKNIWLGTLFHFASILSLLNAVSAIFFVPVLWLIERRRNLIERIKMISIWALINIPVVFWVWYALKAEEPYSQTGMFTPLLERLPRAINILGSHICHSLWPWPLNFGYPFNPFWTLDFNFMTGILFLVVLTIAVIWRYHYLFKVGLSFFLIYLLPALMIFYDAPNAIIYDRYHAQALAGIFLIIAGIIFTLTQWLHRWQLPVLTAFFLIMIAWVCMSVVYIPKFNSNVTYMEYSYSHYSGWRSVPFNLAIALISDGQLKRAEDFVNKENSFAYPDWVRSYMLGRIQLESGNLDQAYNLLFSASAMCHAGGYYPFADVPLAKVMVLKGNKKMAKQILSNLLLHPMKNPLETYRAHVLLKKIDREK